MTVFLFTDIENSTRLWEEHRGVMGAVLSRHDALLALAVAGRGGEVVKHLGDGIFAAFAGGDPMGCALDIQRRVAAEDWGDVGELRVRVALHAGEAEERGGDFFGPAVNRCTRLLAVGWGGQILVTPEVAGSCALPPGAAVLDLGVHVLKDVAEPQPILQLVHPELPRRDFPPLRSRAARPGNLPPQPTPFVGREKEIAALVAIVNQPSHRLLSLVGPGGVGKTRLALEVAAAVLERFEWGAYFVPLAPHNEPARIVASIADALNFSFYGREEPKTQLLNYLREKPLLLILDNFEHLTAGASLAAEILEAAPGVRIIITSRERLRLRGEQVYEVGGLPYPRDEKTFDVESFSAVQLFLQGARRVQSDFTPRPEERPCLARICRFVQGMPLGLDLAATWVRTLSLAEIAAEIERDLDFLGAGLRDLPERHQSLRTVFDYSWRLLTDDERRALSRLAVFRGGFTAEAAWAVAGAPLVLLSALAEKSLLRRSADGRYDILEVIRQYAAEKPGPGEGDELGGRHAAYFAAFLQGRELPLRTEGQREALAAIGADIDNIREAWSWAVSRGDTPAVGGALHSLFTFYDTRGWFAEGAESLSRAADRLAAVAGDGPAEEVLARVRSRLGWLCFRLYKYDRAREFLNESLAYFRSRGLDAEAAAALNRLGAAALRVGDYAEAKRLCGEALAFYQALGDRGGVAGALENLGNIASRMGEYQEAREYYSRSLALNREIGDRRGVASSLSNLGDIANTLGDFATAQNQCEESLTIQREIGFPLGVAGSLNNLGDVARARADYGRAQALYDESHAIQVEIGNRWGVALALENLGGVAHDRGDYDRAARLYDESLAIRREIGDRRGAATSECALADVAYTRGDYAAAHDLYDKGLAIQREIGDRHGVARTLNRLGDVAIKSGDFTRARELYRESLALARELGDPRGVATSLNNLANVACSFGEYDESKRLYHESLALSRGIGYRRGISYALNNLGDVYEEEGDYNRARELYAESLAIDREVGDRRGIAVSLNNLGCIYLVMKDYAAARPLLTEGMALCRETGYREGLAFCLTNLGQVATALGDHEAANEYFRRGLRTAVVIGAVPWVLETLVGMAALALAQGGESEAAPLLTFALHHAASERANKDRAAELLATCSAAAVSRVDEETLLARRWEDVVSPYVPDGYLSFASEQEAALAEELAHEAGFAAAAEKMTPPGMTPAAALRASEVYLPVLSRLLAAKGLNVVETVTAD